MKQLNPSSQILSTVDAIIQNPKNTDLENAIAQSHTPISKK
jgi:hypothetical protein